LAGFGVDAGRYIADGITGLTVSNNSCFFGDATKGTQNATNEQVFGYNATGNGSNTVTIGDSNITNTYLKGVVSTDSTAVSTSTTTGAIRGASLGITGAIFAGTVSANSYNLIPIWRGGGNISTNTVVGMNAGYSNTTGNNNSFVGMNAGYSNTTGNNNSFVGMNAGLSNTTGNNNSFVGVNAGRSNTTGNNNSFVGVNAGLSNTTGNNNSFVGMNAGLSNTTGNNNSFVGVNAGRYTSDGVTDLTISNNSCFFGMNTKGTQNATNENVFCYNATGNGSNTVTIGDSDITNNFFRGALSLNGTQVISTRRTGWVAPTGTATRTTFATSTVTLTQLAERVKALIDDLTTHGLIGA
jgi:carbonic anhydrase/acetyltransferase-like protein (isoleucine patch superfamily)